MPVRVTTDVDLAVERLRAGGLVAIPTETVYGLAADAEQPAAVQRIFAAKGRPADHPLIVHLARPEQVDDGWCDDLPASARALATACWPGPLTMLLRRGPRVLDLVTGGRPSVGIRVPAHPVTHALLERFGGGVAAPSANRFGKVSPTTADHVVTDLAGVLDPDRDLVLDGGPARVGVESTIIDLTVEPPELLRAGAITAEDVARIVDADVAASTGPSRASGMLSSHYAPDCSVIPVESYADAVDAAERSRAVGRRVQVLDRTGDLVVAARELYTDLRRADADGVDELIVVLPPPVGLGHALRDRLFKAAADRPGRSTPAG